MPAKKSAKTKPKSRKWSPSRLEKVVIGGLVVLFLVLVLVKVHEFQQNRQADRDKVRLEQVDQEMKMVQSEIIKEIGQPQYQENNKSCFRPNLKGGGGQLVCDANLSISYGIDNKQQGVELTKRITSAVNNSNVTRIKSQLVMGSVESVSNSMSIDLFPNDILGIRCSMEGSIDKSEFLHPNFQTEITLDSPLTYIFSFSCSKPTPKPFYKLDH
jgi:hypothetical protein